MPKIFSPVIFNEFISAVVTSSEYVIEGYCTGGWILSPEEEQWVEKLRADAENEARVFQDLVKKGSSASVADEAPSRSKEKKKSTSKVNSPDTQSEQATWLLKIFSEQEQTDLIELKLDNSRKESVRAMKLAWESAEPGRHLKGHQARIAYLNSFEESGDPIPTVDQLMQKAKKGSLPENPETAIQNFAERRAAVEEYRRLEEEERKNDLVNTQKEYEGRFRNKAAYHKYLWDTNCAGEFSLKLFPIFNTLT